MLMRFSIEDGDLLGWLRDELVAPLTQGVYGSVERILQEVRGFTEVGRYTFRHGIAQAIMDKPESYTLDFDFYEDNIQYDAVLSLVSQFNQQNFRFFRWAIGPKALDRLGKATAKPVRT